MPETVLLFDLFGVIAHHQSPEGRNRLLETVAPSCTATGAFWDTYWRLRPRYDQGLLHASDTSPLEPSSPVLPPDAAGYSGGKG